jgi:hypothetical protein
MNSDQIRRDDVLIDNLTLLIAAPHLEKTTSLDLIQELTTGYLLEALVLHERLIYDPLQPTPEGLTQPISRFTQTKDSESYILANTRKQSEQIENTINILPKGLIEPVAINEADKLALLGAGILTFPDLGFNWEWYCKMFVDNTIPNFSKPFQELLVKELSRIVGIMNFGEWAVEADSRHSRIQSYFRLTGSIKKQAYYLSLSRFLGVPFLANPFRSNVYRAFLAGWNKPNMAKRILDSDEKADSELIEEAVIDEFESKVIARIDEMLKSVLPWQTVSFPLPPLMRRVYSLAREKGITPLDAAIEIRNSKNAVAFRNWSKEVLNAYEQGSRKDLIRLLKALQSECHHWIKKMDDGDSNSSLSISLFGINYKQDIPDPFYKLQTRFRKHILFLREMI